jgi:succinate dehydrogenase / fumarate reductase flavoprotein subunit
MGRNAEGLAEALVEIPKLREEFYANVRIPGDAADLNSELEKVMRVADYFELGELMCYDALQRNESCGGHFREEYQTEEGEALRDDENFTYVAAWQYAGEGNRQILNKEPLGFEYVKLSQRSYK